MATLYSSVAVYSDDESAEQDWAALEASTESVDIADAAFIRNKEGEAVTLQRQSRHGWGKGAVVGALVGVLFPPSLIGTAAVGAGGGALVARFSRSLGRNKVKDLGEALDSGSLAILVVAPPESTEAIKHLLQHAKTVQTASSASREEIEEALTSSGAGRSTS